MTEKQALQEGLIFTGTYESLWGNVESVAQEAKRIRKLGFRAVMVNEENGKSVYADRAYFDYCRYEDCKKRLANMPARKEFLNAKYEKELAELEAEEAKYQTAIKKYEEARK